MTRRLRYVALGDSFTIGTGVAEQDRWPNQLVVAIDEAIVGLDLVANLGVNGYTTQDLIDRELPPLQALRPEFVSVLIGVNDIVQGVPADRIRERTAFILDAVVAAVGAASTLVVTIPDYTVTPAGADYGDPVKQAARIRATNASSVELAAARGMAVVDIYDISLAAAADRALVAGDGLHPSGAQYAQWVERIAPALEELLGR